MSPPSSDKTPLSPDRASISPHPSRQPPLFTARSLFLSFRFSLQVGVGDVARYNTADDDNFTQAGCFYREVLDEGARDRLTSNIAGHLVAAQDFIQRRAVANFAAADRDYGARIARKMDALKKKQHGKRGGGGVARAAPLNPPRAVPGPVYAKGAGSL